MYSTKTKLTKEVCEKMGFIFDIGFVKTMKRTDKIYVSFTIGKPHEIASLKKACNDHGYIWKK